LKHSTTPARFHGRNLLLPISSLLLQCSFLTSWDDAQCIEGRKKKCNPRARKCADCSKTTRANHARRLDTSVLTISLSLQRHPFIWILFTSRFTCYYKTNINISSLRLTSTQFLSLFTE
jgi:hypothetical protein